jgi:hypothetical protein
MTDDDPNEAYEVVPHEPGPHGPRLKVGGPSSEAAFRLSTFPARKSPSDTRPIRNTERAWPQERRGRRRRGNDMSLRPAGRPWTLTDDDMLRKLLASGMNQRLIALAQGAVFVYRSTGNCEAYPTTKEAPAAAAPVTPGATLVRFCPGMLVDAIEFRKKSK